MKKFFKLSMLSILASACAAMGPATYGPIDESGFGYEETRIESDRFRIVYNGSGGMPPELVEDFALQRAAELTLDNGGDWFRVAFRDVMREQRGGVNVGAGIGSGRYGRRTGVGVGVGGDFGRVGAQDYFSVRLEILIGSGDAPDDPDVYLARDLLDALLRQSGE